jgi:hypothetical protein
MNDALIVLPGGSPVPIAPAVIDAARRALRADMGVFVD